MTIRVLIADDHAVVREGLSAILTRQPDLVLVGQAANGVEAVTLAQHTRPDVILLDLVMPGLDGLEALHAIRSADAQAHILVLTSFANDARIFAAIKAGALGYLLKDATPGQLVQAIRDVAQGRPALDPAIALKVMQELAQPSPLPPAYALLTPREMDTLRLLARGLSNQEIAAVLNLHERTVVKYVTHILHKLHLSNRTQAALYAQREAGGDA